MFQTGVIFKSFLTRENTKKRYLLNNIQNPGTWDYYAFRRLGFLSIEGVSMSLKLFPGPWKKHQKTVSINSL